MPEVHDELFLNCFTGDEATCELLKEYQSACNKRRYEDDPDSARAGRAASTGL